jgi:hypothetical protein
MAHVATRDRDVKVIEIEWNTFLTKQNMNCLLYNWSDIHLCNEPTAVGVATSANAAVVRVYLILEVCKNH